MHSHFGSYIKFNGKYILSTFFYSIVMMIQAKNIIPSSFEMKIFNNTLFLQWKKKMLLLLH
ncbi:hypothetical protein DERP_008836 [Dermatophagoides pteronyssinus]|uniref:Uncharacterized protein n=1 Tax=Dermatophagoides pteronyssinus TaxID=6956 RepID=A0ABQ8IWG8_DERPT|nr:hypothetical protein DERP_008836 [Dermatophagoides pteronyssinus]